jgi:excisionase family DNA binding protein
MRSAEQLTAHQPPDQDDGTPQARSELLTATQAAERMNVPERFIRRLVFEHRIRFYKVGRYVRIASADLDDYLNTNRIDPDQPRRHIDAAPGR